MIETAFSVPDMHCSACVSKVSKALAGVPGAATWQVNALRRQLFVEHDDDADTLSILRALEGVGFHPVIGASDEHGETDRALLARLGVAALGMMQVMMAAVALYMAGDVIDPAVERLLQWTSLTFATVVVGFSATPFLVGAGVALAHRSVTMDVPIGLAIAVAFTTSVYAVVKQSGEIYFDSVVMFTFLLLGARYLDARLRTALRSPQALALVPHRSERIAAHGLETVDVSALAPGDSIWVRPGDRVPVDGRAAGSATVDESTLSGESRPVSKLDGEAIFAGSLALSAFPVRVTEVTQTRLHALGQLAQTVHEDRAPVVMAADRVARIFVPAILVLAVLTWFGWYLFDPSQAFSASLAVLVISCPCALSLAAPAAMTAAMASLRRRGAIFRDSGAVERLARVTHALVDKTGTLTLGKPRIRGVTSLAATDLAVCRGYVSALERHVSHPIARAFDDSVQYVAQDVTVEREGVSGRIDGHRVAFGSAGYVRRATHCAETPTVDGALHLAIDGNVSARFEVDDELRPGAVDAIDALKQLGIELRLVSGDHEDACRRVASALAIPYESGTTPESKLAAIEDLERRGKVVLAIGDGVNDVPLLAAADVSVAVLEAPATVREHADVVVASSSIGVLTSLVTTARRATGVLRQNLAWAFAYNLLAIPAAALGWVPPWLAALGMSASSLAVMLNAVRLTRGDT